VEDVLEGSETGGSDGVGMSQGMAIVANIVQV
jgi:hypothetical protein